MFHTKAFGPFRPFRPQSRTGHEEDIEESLDDIMLRLTFMKVTRNRVLTPMNIKVSKIKSNGPSKSSGRYSVFQPTSKTRKYKGNLRKVKATIRHPTRGS